MKKLLAVKIRLRRMGTKKKPFYRIVVTDVRSPRDGKFIETIGHYDPRNQDDLVLDLDKVENWQKRGAQPTNAVGSLIKRLKKQREAEKKESEKKKTKEQVEKPEKEE